MSIKKKKKKKKKNYKFFFLMVAKLASLTNAYDFTL